MTRSKKSKIVCALCAFMLMLTMSISASANSMNFSKDLPTWQGHIDLCIGSKDTIYANNAIAKIDSIGNSNTGAYMWIDSYGGGQVSKKVFIKKGGSYQNIAYNSVAWTGTVRLRSHAEYFGSSKTAIKGAVNFG